MNILIFIIAIYFIGVGITGNGEKVGVEISTQKDFLPWITATGILWIFYQYSPRPVQPETRLMIILSLTTLLLLNYNTFEDYSNKLIEFLQGK